MRRTTLTIGALGFCLALVASYPSIAADTGPPIAGITVSQMTNDFDTNVDFARDIGPVPIAEVLAIPNSATPANRFDTGPATSIQVPFSMRHASGLTAYLIDRKEQVAYPAHRALGSIASSTGGAGFYDYVGPDLRRQRRSVSISQIS